MSTFAQLEARAAAGDEYAQLRPDRIYAELQVLQELTTEPQQDTAVLKRVRLSGRHQVWRLTHPFHPRVAVRLIVWFPPEERDRVVVALFVGEKASMGDVFIRHRVRRTVARCDPPGASTTPPASMTVPVPRPAVTYAPSSTAAPSAGVPACTSATTQLTAEPQQPANRNGATLLHFTNTSSHPCTTQGYPGVAVLNAAGQQQYQAIREPAGYFGGLQPGQSPPLVSLSPGQEATAILEVSDVYPNGNFCPSAPALLVTMPGDTTSRKVPTKISDCGSAAISPLLSGTTGSG